MTTNYLGRERSPQSNSLSTFPDTECDVFEGSSVPVAANVGYRAAKWADEGQLRVIGVNSPSTNERPFGRR